MGQGAERAVMRAATVCALLYGAVKQAQSDLSHWKSKPHKGRFWTRQLLVRMVRIMYVSVILAMYDLCTLSVGGSSTVFSIPTSRTGNGDAIFIGFGYILLNHEDIYRDRAKTFGPEIWFWFTPVIVDAAHGGVQVHWLWSH
jgi:hypothetical protein